jgi:RNA polymerase sigma-70 factor, ECF subfamily
MDWIGAMDQEITLLSAARKMNHDALARIFELYSPVLFKYIFRLCNDVRVAEQLVGDVFERFVQQLSVGQNPGVNLRACLFEIAHNLLVRDVRYTSSCLSSNWNSLKQGDRGAADLNAEDQMVVNAIHWALIHDLTEDQRHVILLRFIEGFSLKETAAITGKKVNHVKVIQNRGVGALRKSIDYPDTETQTITVFLRRMAQAEQSPNPSAIN